MAKLSNHTAIMDSPIGKIRLESLGGMLRRLDFVDEDVAVSDHFPGILQKARKQLTEYFDGRRKKFNIPIYADGTHFQMNVWDHLKRIEYGRTWSYEDLARRLGDKKVIRAAAAANGRNPIAIIIPCHRVIGKDGSLTGYSGGMWRKKFLLELEAGQYAPLLFDVKHSEG